MGFFGPGGTKFRQKVHKIYDVKAQELDAARHPLQIVDIEVDNPVKKWDMMRKYANS
ncbi:hypothetical protein J2Z66_007330 [Paenibacillus eucommiae]|uniref:Peptidase family U32 C-terminal domain-containing protein n=1 Tax=Paenibacillus eucommiae TaxID=1355755 RepID=A0ABS4J797_9BACL|nr:hypothetical protein [Paenibacillus eucommiae]